MTEQTYDLNQLDVGAKAEEGTQMPVRHPITGKPIFDEDGTPWTITLLGADSPSHTQALHKRANKRAKEGMKGGFRGRNLTAEQIDADELELLIHATKAWHIRLDGELLGSSDEVKRDTYQRFQWLRDQAEAWMGDRANYLGEQSSSSSNSHEEPSSTQSRRRRAQLKEPS